MMLHSARGTRGRAMLGAAALAGMVGLSACDSPVDEGPEPYALVTVNAQSLPAPYPDPFLYPQGTSPSDGALRVANGTLTLEAGGALRLELVMRCASPLPAGTECEIEGDGRNVHEGTYSLSEDLVQIDDRQYPVRYESGSVEIMIQVPPSAGMWPTFVLEFRR